MVGCRGWSAGSSDTAGDSGQELSYETTSGGMAADSNGTIALGLGLGNALGAGTGTAIGALTGDLPFWLGMGIGLGSAFGTALGVTVARGGPSGGTDSADRPESA